MKSIYEIEDELHMKAKRVGYWDTFNMLPSKDDLTDRGDRLWKNSY